MLSKIQKLAVEMVVVGAGLVTIMVALRSFASGLSLFQEIFLAGAFFHLIFEASGANSWYAKQYKPLLS